jgi:nitrogen fixation/metabolism regulation signal transduction histidine kinase
MKRIRFWLRTLANLLSGLREGDYSFRARTIHHDDIWSELVGEVNLLADHLRGQRLDAREAAGLLRNVMAEIPLGVFTFDPDRHLRFVNPAGINILGEGRDDVLGRTALDLGLNECLNGAANRTLDLHFGSNLGRWALRRTTVRQEGHPYQLIVLSDLSRVLREEERLAWQRIVRVLGHEVNNSLAPIQSIAASLEKLLAGEARSNEWEQDTREGLAVIRGRSESLNRFMQAYARLARLPPPTPRLMQVDDWILKAVALETRIAPVVHRGPPAMIHADRDQLDQLLITLIRNATDAALAEAEDKRAHDETGNAQVEISWSTEDSFLLIYVADNGPGVVLSENLFVPFFTTKSGGSGIGLALCRQIAESHDGALTLANRVDARGAIATLRLPFGSREQPNVDSKPAM